MKISLYSKFIDPLLKDIRKFVIEFGEIKKGEKVLDVGCGTGDQAFFLLKFGAIVAGIDISPKMVEIALEKKKKEKTENILFQAADAANLPFLDPVFDVALISLVLHEIENEKRNRIISEMKRVVKKDGRLIFIDFNVPLLKTISAFFVKIIERFAGKEHYLNFQSYLKEGGLPSLLERNNLKPEKIEYLKNKLLIAILAKNNKKF